MLTLVRSDYIAFGLYFETYTGRNISKLSEQKIRLRLDSSFRVGLEVETVFGPVSRSRLELYSFQQRQLVRATSKAKGASDRRPTAKQLFSKPPYNLFNPAKVAPLPLLRHPNSLFDAFPSSSHSSAPPPFVEGGGDMGTQWVLEENACMWAAEGVRPEHGCHGSDHILISSETF